jgi:thiol-disulfide isomerase/thioredoxin
MCRLGPVGRITLLLMLIAARSDDRLAAQGRSSQSAEKGPTAAPTMASSPLPRYQFAVGEQLTYAEDQEIPLLDKRADKRRRNREDRWQIFVLNHNSDGSWRLLLYRTVRLVDQKPKSPPSEIFSNSMLAYCDLSPDGRIAQNPTLGDSFDFEINPYWLFAPLPPDQNSLATGWSGTSPVGELTLDCSLESGTPGSGSSIVMNCVEHAPLLIIYGQTKNRRYVFDRQAGRVRRIEFNRARNDGKIHSQSHSTATLESDSKKPSRWIEPLRKEADQFFSANADYHKRMEEVGRSRTAKDCETEQFRARQLLATAQKTCELEPIRDGYRAQLKVHDREAPWKTNEAKAREKVYARGPADWDLTAFDGGKHRLKECRGKVVVLDFWYRYCPYCIKALPQIKQVAEKYKNKHVVVLGMNIDPNEDDARFVIREKGLLYANLKAQPAVSAYAADELGYPVLYILGQDGRVSEIHTGYSPDLGDQVSDAIDRLLRAGEK